MVALADTLGALVALAVAVFFSVSVVPQVELVELEMCTFTEAPGARLPKLQTKVWLGAAPVMEQVPGPP
jgi:hypothetical protein